MKYWNIIICKLKKDGSAGQEISKIKRVTEKQAAHIKKTMEKGECICDLYELTN